MDFSVSHVKELQKYLINFGLVDPPVDGVLGKQTLKATEIFADLYGVANSPEAVLEKAKTSTLSPIKPINDFVALTIQECQDRGFYLSRGVNAPNIVYIEGVDIDGDPNPNYIDEWNDVRALLVIEHNGKAYFQHIWTCTVNAGRYYTDNPMNPRGAANIKAPLQVWAWRVGRHITSSANQEALVQVKPVPVMRDRTGDGRTKDDRLEDWEIIGLNQHWGSGRKVGRWSAGCLVGQSETTHDIFLNKVKAHRCYLVDRNYIFGTIVLDNKFLK